MSASASFSMKHSGTVGTTRGTCSLSSLRPTTATGEKTKADNISADPGVATRLP